MARGIFDSPLVGIVNKVFVGLIDAPVVGPFVRRAMINIRYVGRRSGKTIETPVGYRRSGDKIVINVMSPDNKTWWRNFSRRRRPDHTAEARRAGPHRPRRRRPRRRRAACR